MSETSAMTAAPRFLSVTVLHLFVSRGHNYKGHYGKPPGRHPVDERPVIQCEKGRGIVGDRYYDHRDNYKGQITFFDQAVYLDLCRRLGLEADAPSAMRRNVILEGVDLNELIGRRFELQGTTFEGTEECRPCFWMDQALAEGAEELMKGSGGLRARILTDGCLRTGPAELKVL